MPRRTHPPRSQARRRFIPKIDARPSKYRNIKAVFDGITFDSQKEARRYNELKILLRAGLIEKLTCHPDYPLHSNGVVVCKYVSDFAYIESGRPVCEDVKSEPTKTPLYRLKRKMFIACYPEYEHREIE